ncbi:MAG: sugar phosphate isomerase/epimerase [FCB group bacterium]|nr:sugar phosphate isomerase/epimerase [FCB group bacterium]
MIDNRKIGFRLTGFREWPLKEALAALADIGYDGVEICLEHPDLNPDNPDVWDSRRLVETLKEVNLAASAVSFHGKRASYAEKYRKCTAGIKLARELDVKTFISGSVLDRNEESWGRCCDFVRDCCAVAGLYDIDFAVEPEPGNMIEDSAGMRKLMNELNCENLKINLDIGHSFITEEDVNQDIKEWRNDLVHIHLEDIKDSRHEHLLPGEGDIDFRRVFAALQDIDYWGFITLDIFNIVNDPKGFAEKALRSLRKAV